MSFLKIADPVKREQTVKEFLAIKKNIRANELVEKTGKTELQTDLSEFFKPVTETQKETQKEMQKAITEKQEDTSKRITEGLRPIKKALKPIKSLKGIKTGIEQLPQRLPLQLPQQIGYPLSTAPPSYRTTSPAPSELSEVPSTSEEKKEMQQEINNSILVNPDTIFGIHRSSKGLHMGNKQVDLTKEKDIIIIDDKTKTKTSFKLTDGLRNLISFRGHIPDSYTANDFSTYGKILKLTGAMHNNNDPTNPHFKWREIDESLREKARIIKEDIWEPYTESEYFKENIEKTLRGKGLKKVVIPSDPNSLLEKFDLLIASKAAGNTGVRNELVSVCDKLKRQGVFDSNIYKKNNVLIIKI